MKKTPTHAVLAIDPGGTTGVAAGYIDLKPTLKETLKTLDMRKAIEVDGRWIKQGLELAQLMWKFQFTANVENAIPLDQIHFVFEDFVLRRQQQGGATGNLTSIWVAAAACGAYASSLNPEHELPIVWQQASHAKTTGTDARLKMWELWEVGSAHKRDAWRHFALRVMKLVD